MFLRVTGLMESRSNKSNIMRLTSGTNVLEIAADTKEELADWAMKLQDCATNAERVVRVYLVYNLLMLLEW